MSIFKITKHYLWYIILILQNAKFWSKMTIWLGNCTKLTCQLFFQQQRRLKFRHLYLKLYSIWPCCYSCCWLIFLKNIYFYYLWVMSIWNTSSVINFIPNIISQTPQRIKYISTISRLGEFLWSKKNWQIFTANKKQRVCTNYSLFGFHRTHGCIFKKCVSPGFENKHFK